MGVPLAVNIALALALLAVAVRLCVAFVDWLDARTSRITDAEASRRARLALIGQWPPPSPIRSIPTRHAVLVLIGLLLLWLVSQWMTQSRRRPISALPATRPPHSLQAHRSPAPAETSRLDSDPSARRETSAGD